MRRMQCHPYTSRSSPTVTPTLGERTLETGPNQTNRLSLVVRRRAQYSFLNIIIILGYFVATKQSTIYSLVVFRIHAWVIVFDSVTTEPYHSVGSRFAVQMVKRARPL
jgi:hypothetical protein